MSDQITDVSSVGGYKDFLLSRDVQAKRSKEWGKKNALYIESVTAAGPTNGYWFQRNERFKQNILWSAGKQNIYAKFADLLQFNGKVNYANLNWKAPLLINRIITGLVGRWMQRQEKIQVTAIDPISVLAKQDQYEQAEFVLYNREQLALLEKESGVPMVPPDQFMAEDKDELEEWSVYGNKLPEEIKYQTGVNEIMDSAGLFDVLKKKLLHDSAECGLVGTYVWMDEYGCIHIEWVKPLNSFYSYSEYDDFRDTAYRGFIKSMKISDLRRKYGKEFGGELSEEEIFKIAASSREFQRFDKLTWTYEWNLAYIRPYDEWSVECIYFWMKSVDDEGYTMTVTKRNNSTILERVPGNPGSVGDNQDYLDDRTWNLYKGVYVRDSQTMLEWGLDNNMIRPQDPKESGNVEFPISFFMYQNQDMRNIAIPEKVEEPVEQMILARLKIQQLIATMIPYGAAINVDAMQEVDLGLAADGKSSIDVQKVYEQTGRLYYRGRDSEGNPIPVPIQELANAGFVAQLQGLVTAYEYHYKVLKDDLGEDPNIITMAAQPRVTTDNVQFSQQQADFATDYIYDAYKYVLEETAKKVACLLNNSVRFGASAYRHIMQEEDVKDRNFSTKFKLLPTQFDLQRFDMYMNQALAANPDLILYVDPFKLTRLAKEDTKLAELYLRNATKKMIRTQREIARQQSEDNMKVQAAAAQEKAESDFKIEQAKAQLEIMKADAKSKADNESALLSGLMELYKAGLPIPPELAALKNLVFQNVAISLSRENQGMIQEAQAEQMAAQQEAAQAQEQQMQPQ